MTFRYMITNSQQKVIQLYPMNRKPYFNFTSSSFIRFRFFKSKKIETHGIPNPHIMIHGMATRNKYHMCSYSQHRMSYSSVSHHSPCSISVQENRASADFITLGCIRNRTIMIVETNCYVRYSFFFLINAKIPQNVIEIHITIIGSILSIRSL